MGMHPDLLPLDAMANGMAGGIPGGLPFIQQPKEEMINTGVRIESGLDSSISSGDSKNNDTNAQLQAQLMNPYNNPLQQSPQLANMLQQPTSITGNSITNTVDPITSSIYKELLKVFMILIVKRKFSKLF